ncbi:MAG: alginate lyase family protein [Calditrichia bacterium]
MWEEIRLLGFRKFLYRSWYEIRNRSGITRRLQPALPIDSQLIEKLLRTRINYSSVSNQDLPFSIGPAQLHGMEEYIGLTAANRNKILQRANDAMNGKICVFSGRVLDYKNPIDWHYNPLKNASWPAGIYSLEPANPKVAAACGDVKIPWEVNRFPHFYAWMRAFLLTGNSAYVRTAQEQIIQWAQANPFRTGINWSSGQEIAIRVLSWHCLFSLLRADDVLKMAEFRELQTLMYLSGEHIYKNINFARLAVHNNHLIGEALALYLLGSYYPHFRDAEKWRKTGRALLEGECLAQFYADGGYCQSSHNYHRLALHYYLWACRIGECLNERFSPEVYETLDRSAEYLASFMNEDGKLPNWGANDGALLNPWTSCDYGDFRPLLTAIRYLVNRKKGFPAGPWDEELFWFFGPEAMKADVAPYSKASKSFPVSGLHVNREDEKNFTAFRCGSVIDRFGQADQLHVDVFWRGLNVLIDGGSYLYNDDPQYYRHFMSTKSHNTVAVDNQDQMLLFRKFKWLYWTRAKLLDFQPGSRMEGEHYGYRRLKGEMTHRRVLEFPEAGTLLVTDTLEQQAALSHHYLSHWLINDFPCTVLMRGPEIIALRFETPVGFYYLAVKASQKASFQALRAVHDEKNPAGWQSRYYSLKTPAISVTADLTAETKAVNFISLFSGTKAVFEKHLASRLLPKKSIEYLKPSEAIL